MIKKNLLLTGAKGQLASTFYSLFEKSPLRRKFNLHKVDIEDFDLADPHSMLTVLSSCLPSLILNCGAFTAVDRAEDSQELAQRVNDESVALMSKWSAENGCQLIHISTDFVFDGSKGTPYQPGDQTNPLGVYGHTKLSGERHVLRLLSQNGIIIRTSWLYSNFGQNFVKTMLKLMVEGDVINVVNDQIGSPTSAYSLSRVLMRIIERDEQLGGVFHWCDGASISWYEFATEIQRCAHKHGILQREVQLLPISTSSYLTKARRPSYSVLDRSETVARLNAEETEWKAELDKVISAIAN